MFSTILNQSCNSIIQSVLYFPSKIHIISKLNTNTYIIKPSSNGLCMELAYELRDSSVPVEFSRRYIVGMLNINKRIEN